MRHEQIAVAHVAANPDNDSVVDSTNHCLCRPVCLNGSPRLVVELVTGSALIILPHAENKESFDVLLSSILPQSISNRI